MSVASSNALDTLLAHDRWATNQLLVACRPLSDSQLDQPFEIGPGSLRKTLTHMLNVVQGWQAALSDQSAADLPISASISDLETAHEKIASAFATFVREALGKPALHAIRRGHKLTGTPEVIFTHILTHGTHHRAQALNMLRHLGVSPLPKSSVMEWSIATGITQLESPQ